MSELKPCPFCGCKVAVENYDRINSRMNSLFKIVAKHNENCILKKVMWAAYFSTEEEAIEAWNRRADDE